MEIDTSGDEARLKPITGLAASTASGQTDLDGHWVRCPARLWSEAAESKKEWIIMNHTGRRFYDGDSTDFWSGSRGSALKYTDKEVAQSKAQDLNGVVVEAGH